MALYRDPQIVRLLDNEIFDIVYKPGDSAPYAGIYRCAGCGHEIGIAQGHTLPAEGHSQHPEASGPISWKLLVFAQHNR